jgi:hypothetical protein
LGKEKVHLGIITRKEDARLWGGLVLDYSFIGQERGKIKDKG